MNQHLKSLWLTETVRLVEKDNGRFQDDEANRQARAKGGELSTRLITRAEFISQRNGLKTAQSDWLNATKIAIIVLLLVALFTGGGIAFSALAQNPVNLYWALFCLLGLHLITLLLWILSSLFLPSNSGSLFIPIWLWLANKLCHKKTINQVLPAFIMLCGKQIRWLIGLIVNLLWTVILISALLVLIILLSTKHYSFEWQTTLLNADSIITLTQYLAFIPTQIGFSLPDSEMIRASEQAMNSGEIRSAWAVWLLGIFVVYGVAVRLTLLIFCWLKWAMACQKIQLDTRYPEYQLLANELMFTADKAITDADHYQTLNQIERNTFHQATGKKKFLVAIDVEPNWLPPEGTEFLGFLNNNQQRTAILDFLQLNPAEKLLIAIDTDRSPDRGIINLIEVLITKSMQSQLWFINQGRQWQNWQQSLHKLNITVTNSLWLLD